MVDILKQAVIDSWGTLDTAERRINEVAARRAAAKKEIEAFRADFAERAALKARLEIEWSARQTALKSEYEAASEALTRSRKAVKLAERALAEDSAKNQIARIV